MAGLAGFFRRHADSGRLLRGLPAFSQRARGLATTFAGVLAVLAPTVGPIVGGWITETYSWHWLFLINVIPGLVCALVAPLSAAARSNATSAKHARSTCYRSSCWRLPRARSKSRLKEAPQRGWTSGLVLGLLALSRRASVGFVTRTLSGQLRSSISRRFGDRSFAIGCILSFVLGIGLFGSVYLMPVFLAFVRGHEALEIGTTMLVTGSRSC